MKLSWSVRVPLVLTYVMPLYPMYLGVTMDNYRFIVMGFILLIVPVSFNFALRQSKRNSEER